MSSKVVEAIFARYGNRSAGVSVIERIPIDKELSISLRRVKKDDGTFTYFILSGTESEVSFGTAA